MSISDPTDPETNQNGDQPLAEHDRLAQPVDLEEPPRLPFPVVGIGASAGGLEAAMEFFASMRADSGMAFVLVQHLPPDRETLIDEILSKKTTMPVCQADDGMRVEANHVYVIRPGHTLTINDGCLHLGEPLEQPMRSRPVDDFFRSLAEEQRERAIAIILSGMGSNGSAGAQAIKAVGGLCIAQEPDSAAFPSMPRHLIDAGYADFILKPADMSGVLLSYADHPYARERGGSFDTELTREQQHAREILAVLRTRTRHDFNGYKKPTVWRRIQRRMGLSRVTKLSEYARILRQTPSEVAALTDDLLIHVTGFFRDPQSWEALRERVIVPLVKSREQGATIRAWVAACSSGEEAYSLAMLLIEEAQRADKRFDIKIFATDTAERTLQNARQGVYPGGIESEITPERLERFFVREDALYRVRPELRELVVFAPQNVLQDPPFSRLDIVTCRNLLIYLEPELQTRVLTLLHFGLREGGALFLGSSETPGYEQMFEPIDKKARIFRRVGPTRHGSVEFPWPPPSQTRPGPEPAARDPRAAGARASVAQITTRALLEHHHQAAVTIDRDYRIIYYHGNTTSFLEQPPGEPTRDLMSVVRDSVRSAVRAALHKATSHGSSVEREHAWIDREDGTREHVAVVVSPAPTRTDAEYYVISFQKLGQWPSERSVASQTASDSAGDLRRVRDELQSTVDELQTSHEELKAAHEEVVSTNEELQSTNEELETSREEMQSLNEELSTVNSQLQAKVEQFQSVSNDLESLLTSTDLAVLFLDTHFRIRRFTPQVKELLEVISTDIGRPFTDLAQKFDDPHLLTDARQVLERLVPSEREVSTHDGHWFVRRITAYRTAENRIEGVVITFVEMTQRRLAEDDLRKSEERLRQAIERAPVPIVMLAENGEVLQLNHVWVELTGYASQELPVLESLLAIADPKEATTFRSQLRDVFRGAIATLRLDLTIRTKAGETRYWNFTASSPGALPDGRRTCVGMAVDITERVLALRELQMSKDAVEAASAMKDQFLANISHELRTPLSVTLLWSKLLARGDVGPDQKERAIDAIVRSAEAQSRLIDDLLDTTRIVSGKLRVTLKPIDLRTVIGAAVEVVRPLAINKSIDIHIEVTKPVGVVLGDSMRLEQIVWILLTNAVKFTPKFGAIRIALAREEDSMVVSVGDNGIGIPPEFLPQIFQPFAQGDENKGTRTGLGLGLSIARSLAQLHSGSITAHSDGLGRGATFTMRLPVVAGDADALALEGPGDESRKLQNARVFVIEDNDDARKAIEAALAKAGARVTGYASAKEAIKAFRKSPPLLVVSDLNMPEMNGLELVSEMRAIEVKKGLDRTRCIALTAMATKSDERTAMASGFDEFLAKPVDPRKLVGMASELLSRPIAAEEEAG